MSDESREGARSHHPACLIKEVGHTGDCPTSARGDTSPRPDDEADMLYGPGRT